MRRIFGVIHNYDKHERCGDAVSLIDCEYEESETTCFCWAFLFRETYGAHFQSFDIDVSIISIES